MDEKGNKRSRGCRWREYGLALVVVAALTTAAIIVLGAPAHRDTFSNISSTGAGV